MTTLVRCMPDDIFQWKKVRSILPWKKASIGSHCPSHLPIKSRCWARSPPLFNISFGDLANQPWLSTFQVIESKLTMNEWSGLDKPLAEDAKPDFWSYCMASCDCQSGTTCNIRFCMPFTGSVQTCDMDTKKYKIQNTVITDVCQAIQVLHDGCALSMLQIWG